MAILDTIHLNFQVLDIKNPSQLIVMDTSIWGVIESKNAIIEVVTPGRTEPKVYTLLKNQTNVFNSSNLFLSPIGVFNGLPDGIYSITIKGSPDTFCKTKTVLKTDKARLDLAEMYIRLGFSDDQDSKNKKRVIRDNELLLRQAEHSILKGDLQKGNEYFKRAIDYIENINLCENCN